MINNKIYSWEIFFNLSSDIWYLIVDAYFLLLPLPSSNAHLKLILKNIVYKNVVKCNGKSKN